MKISFFDNNGRITGVLSADDLTIELNKQIQSNWIDGEWSGDTHYVHNGKAVQRPNNPTVLDGLTLRNVPAPCKMFINAKQYDIDDTKVELDFPMSAKYKITVQKFPYLDAEFEIET